ncbi:MAG: HAD family hydrolase [Propionicimonas sp.]
MPEDLRLIATDLDGTFLTTAKTVSAVNLAAARRAAELDIPLVVATGRPVRWLEVVSQVGLVHPQVIVSNGAAVYDLPSRTVVRSFPLDGALALAVAGELQAVIPGITFGFETPTGFGCEPASPSRQRGQDGVQEAPLAELVEVLGPVIKLLGFHPEIDSDELVALAAGVVGERMMLTHALTGDAYGMLELTAPGVSKASTLALVCAELGVAAAEVVAFGDMPNDLGMLSWVGRGYVVANAHPQLLGAGFAVVPSNDEDGVGRTILDLLATH